MDANFITIDDSLRLVLARLEGALGVFFAPREIDRVFTDAVDNQRDEKRYVFQRVRRWGFLHPSSRHPIEMVRLLIAVALKKLWEALCETEIVEPERAVMSCQFCGGAMISLGYTPPEARPPP